MRADTEGNRYRPEQSRDIRISHIVGLSLDSRIKLDKLAGKLPQQKA